MTKEPSPVTLYNKRRSYYEERIIKRLNNEQLEAVAGGCSDVGNARKCPECGADNAKLEKDYDTNPGKLLLQYTCKKCGHKWTK
ncbi:MAG TPA: hypothetical protein DCR12_03740 [Lachnospiraceae bacterium]|nr:hypothetical protein [Lachnospiraceae bacterium]